MNITDTQILSYYYKGAAPLPSYPILISSITAAEFLLIQSESPNNANYYPILPTRLRHRMGTLSQIEAFSPRLFFDSTKHAAYGKQRTDQLLLNFGGSMPSFIEFGGIAISQLINSGHEDIYYTSISRLEKDLQKKLRDKFRFLISSNVQCIAVNSDIADVGMNILGQFLDKYEAKRNCKEYN